MTTIDIQAFLRDSTIESHVFEQWVERRWIVLAEDTRAVTFSEVDAARAMLIRDLTGDMGVNDAGVDVVLHLLDQMHGMRRLMQELRVELDAMQGGVAGRSATDR